MHRHLSVHRLTQTLVKLRALLEQSLQYFALRIRWPNKPESFVFGKGLGAVFNKKKKIQKELKKRFNDANLDRVSLDRHYPKVWAALQQFWDGPPSERLKRLIAVTNEAKHAQALEVRG